MAIRRIESHGELGCLERIEYLSPEGEWVQHPTRGSWAPCGTYSRTLADGSRPKFVPEKVVETNADSAPNLGRSYQSIQKMSTVAYLPGQEPEDQTDETPKQDKKKSFPWLFLVAALVVGYFILFRK